MLTQAHIHQFLQAHGISRDATVLIHTSMRALGEVENGCDGVIDAFCSYLCDGLLLIPTHTWNNVTAENPLYDVRTTPPCIGALPTVAAFRKDGIRSLHPTHSVAAFGKRAKAYVAGEERFTTPCPPEGVWGRLYEENATVLLIGVALNRNTYFHAVDEMIPLQGRLQEPFAVTVVDHEGTPRKARISHHQNTGSENFTNFRAPMEALGALTYGTLGNATVGILNARRATEIYRMLWERADYPLCAEQKEIPLSYYADQLHMP